MKIDIFQPLFKNIEGSPLHKAWLSTGMDVKFYPGNLSLNYRNKFELLIKNYPKLFLFALINSYRALTKRDPDFIIVNSDVEVIAVSLIKFLLLKKSKIILLGFIFTRRKSRQLKVIRRFYFKLVLSLASISICHSTYEKKVYDRYFNLSKLKIHYIPYALHVYKPKDDNNWEEEYIVSAGRSNRDYKLLIQVATDLPYRFKIICDNPRLVSINCNTKNIEVISGCYGANYISILNNARLIVIPLAVSDISAGQMVLLQAMALGKPVIITKTRSTIEYGSHLKTVYFCKLGDLDDLKSAILYLMQNRSISDQISSNAKKYYEENHTIESYVKNIAHLIVSMQS
ncbi:MAG: glycosyltransferase [Methylohalobius sp.]|nr:glycosyltransferase [Methylohalobius sp.]